MEQDEQESEKINFNVYVGSERGVLKGVYFGKSSPILKNFPCDKSSEQENNICSLAWTDPENKELIIGFEDGNIKMYNSKIWSFTHGLQLDIKSSLVGVYKISDDQLVTGLQNGKLCIYSTEKEKNTLEISTGLQMSVIRQFQKSSIFATGGEETDLKIYDLTREEQPGEPLFKAKNVRHDFLELRVPVWVQDLTFMNESSELVSTCSRHGQVRLYDVKAAQRPVIDFHVFDDEGLMSMCDTGQAWQVVVGGIKGSMALVDVRYPGKGKLVHKYSAHSGSVRSIDFKNNHIVACGLDRHLYLYNMHEKKALKKLYLKTRLSKVIMIDDFHLNKEKNHSWHNITGEVINSKRRKIK